MARREPDWILQTWRPSRTLGQALPTVPLWLADNLAVPLEREMSHQSSCDVLNLP